MYWTQTGLRPISVTMGLKDDFRGEIQVFGLIMAVVQKIILIAQYLLRTEYFTEGICYSWGDFVETVHGGSKVGKK